jgi:hypothetical protein
MDLALCALIVATFLLGVCFGLMIAVKDSTKRWSKP